MASETDDDVASSLTSSLNLARELKSTSDALGKSISGAFAKGVIDGRRFEDVLKSIGQRMIAIGVRAAFKPVETLLQSAIGSAFSSITGAIGAQSAQANAMGGLFQAGSVTPFAAGGVISQPTYFPMRGGLGLMGERGAEAVMPLQRDSAGRLGVRAASTPAAPITVNIATQDADSFRRSEAQIAGALARAVARGRRAV